MAVLLGILIGLAALMWFTGVARSRRRRGEDGQQEGAARSDRANDQRASDAARHALIAELLGDAKAHEQGRYGELGRQFAVIEAAVRRSGAPELAKVHIALTFWRAWLSARDRRWNASSGAVVIPVEEWPMLARRVASELAVERHSSGRRLRVPFASLSRPPVVAGTLRPPAPAAPGIQ